MFKYSISELSGSFGDLGTLLPLLVALSKSGQVSLGASLVFGGLFNITTGLIYDIPMCVQPMKSIAAIAISSKMTPDQIASAGIFVSAVVLFLGVTRTLTLVNSYIPICVVRGIQAGTGYSLVIKGVAALVASHQFNLHADLSLADNYVVSMICFLYAMWTYSSKRNIAGLVIFGLGVVLSIVKIAVMNINVPLPSVTHAFPAPFAPSLGDFGYGIMTAGLGQVPLTLLNSVIATSMLADDLFPNKSKPVASVESVATCVGLMNLIGCWFGSIPFCHGSGGMAAQYRFGARSGMSILFLGILKVVCGLFFADPFLILFQNLPTSVLGVMLIIAGLELASTQKDLSVHYITPKNLQDATVTFLVTAGAILGFNNDGVGFIAGMVAWVLLQGFSFSKKESPSMDDTMTDDSIDHVKFSNSVQDNIDHV